MLNLIANAMFEATRAPTLPARAAPREEIHRDASNGGLFGWRRSKARKSGAPGGS